MYRGFDSVLGRGPTVYRTPKSISYDISCVKNAINEINSRLNIRSLLLEIVSDKDVKSPEDVVPTLEAMVSLAEDALSELRALKEELFMLEDELYEVKCEMGI